MPDSAFVEGEAPSIFNGRQLRVYYLDSGDVNISLHGVAMHPKGLPLRNSFQERSNCILTSKAYRSPSELGKKQGCIIGE